MLARATRETVSPLSRKHALRAFLRGVAMGGLGIVLVSALTVSAYVAKSAAGINLLPGHSVLHKPLYPIAQAVRATFAGLQRGW